MTNILMTPKTLCDAADMADYLNTLLEECNKLNLFPNGLLMGFDLDYLASNFAEAALKMENNV